MLRVGIESQSPSETQPTSQSQVAEQVPGRHLKWQEENRTWLNILNPSTADTELKTFDFKNQLCNFLKSYLHALSEINVEQNQYSLQ